MDRRGHLSDYFEKRTDFDVLYIMAKIPYGTFDSISLTFEDTATTHICFLMNYRSSSEFLSNGERILREEKRLTNPRFRSSLGMDDGDRTEHQRCSFSNRK